MYASLLLVLIAILGPQQVLGHTYHLGACPTVEPMPGFQMSKMLGVWYVIQKTSTGSSCIVYNFTTTNEPGEYNIEQVSQHLILGLTPLSHEYHYSGKLTVPDESVPAKMTVKFPLSIAGDASYTVFSTDYDNYAAIYTCQKITFSHRQSVSILSRQRTLDKLYIDKIRSKLQSWNISPFDLSIISQKNCPKAEEGPEAVNINIDSDTFSPQSIAGVVRKAGEKIGDGVEFVVDGAKKVYTTYAKKDDSASERLTVHPDAEWLP